MSVLQWCTTMKMKVPKNLRVLLAVLLTLMVICLMNIQRVVDMDDLRKFELEFLKEDGFTTERIMERRLISLDLGCSSELLREYKFNFSQNNERFYVDEMANLSYCKVPKAGSTFWTKIFLILRSMNNKGNLAAKSVVGTNRHTLHAIGNSIGTKRPLFDESLSTLNVVVSRDPYSRLYSAFVDKYFLLGHIPQAKVIARENGRGQQKIDEYTCGYNISFQEFLDYAMDMAFKGKTMNRHWSPVYLLCHPCDVKYHIVSKVESLTRDVEHVINFGNVSESTKNTLREIFRGKRKNERLISLIRAYYGIWRENRKICPRQEMFYSKLIQAFQIQGIIRMDQTIPLSKLKSLDIDTFIKFVIRNVALYPVDKEEKQKQRMTALAQAWKSIDRNTIRKIKKLYSLDFLLFEYDTNPPA